MENKSLISLFQSFCLDTNNKSKEAKLKSELDSYVLGKDYNYGSTKDKMKEIISEAFKHLLNVGITNNDPKKIKPKNNVRIYS